MFPFVPDRLDTTDRKGLNDASVNHLKSFVTLRQIRTSATLHKSTWEV